MARSNRGAAASTLMQLGIYAVVIAVVALLMPCSPFSLWGGAWCPINTAPAVAPVTVPATVPPAAFDFERDVVAASRTRPVLVDFNATWCGPCRMLAPELHQLADERSDRLTLVPIDVDQQPQLAQAHGISSIPAVRLWRDGKEVAGFVGYRSKADIAAWIDQAVANP